MNNILWDPLFENPLKSRAPWWCLRGNVSGPMKTLFGRLFFLSFKFSFFISTDFEFLNGYIEIFIDEIITPWRNTYTSNTCSPTFLQLTRDAKHIRLYVRWRPRMSVTATPFCGRSSSCTAVLPVTNMLTLLTSTGVMRQSPPPKCVRM